MVDRMSHISTHILDTSIGRPAAGVLVRLEHRQGAEWQMVGSAETDTEGRCKEILPADYPLVAGTYRLAFETATYFASSHVTGLYPVVEITFEVRADEDRFNIPLLLSPHGYTTYRGN